jgi:hypothetical protein
VADVDSGLEAVAELLEQAGRHTDAAADYTRRAQDRLAEGQLFGIVRNMDRILAKLDADHALIDSQRRDIDSFRTAAISVDDESVPQQIVDTLTPVAEGIRASLGGLDALDTELAATQDLTGEVLVGGAPHHIQTRIQRIRDTIAAARQRLESASATVDSSLRAAREAGGISSTAVSQDDAPDGPQPASTDETPDSTPTHAEGVQDAVAAHSVDPHAGPGALGDRFAAGVHEPAAADPRTRHAQHERDAAAVIASEGADVRLCAEDHSRHRQTSIDAWVRWDPDDVGTGTELKSVLTATNTSNAMKRDMLKAGKQLDGQLGHAHGTARGQSLIDARPQQPTADQTLQACRGAVGQANAHGQMLAARTLIVLDNDTVCVFEPRTVDSTDGRTVYMRPDERSFRTVRRDDQQWASIWRWA